MSVHNLLGETIDTVCFILVLTGTLLLFSYYWNDTYCLEYAEHVTNQFFDEAERIQMITEDSYVTYARKMNRINGFHVNLQIKRDTELFLQEDIQEILQKEEIFCLQEGDFLTMTISKGTKRRSVLFALIWW